MVMFRIRRLLLPLLLCWSLSAVAGRPVRFQELNRRLIEARLKNVASKNDQREAGLKQMFTEAGCKGDNLSEQVVKPNLPPNLICTLPGRTQEIIVVGAHTDHVTTFGDGVVDNWSGASLLPSFFQSLNIASRWYTFVFVGFTDEEQGMVGSNFYVHQLSEAQRRKIVAMVNLDSLGVGPTEVWATHADQPLLGMLLTVANAMKLPLSTMNVDKVGSTDSESFALYKIPRITIHSITQSTWHILHSNDDKLSAIKMDDYFESYRLLTRYLAFLDSALEPPASALQGKTEAEKTTH